VSAKFLARHFAPSDFATRGTVRILIVEDDLMIGSSLARGLKDEGYAVDWLRDGMQAEAALQDPTNDFQLLLLDLGLPQTDGMELLRGLRKSGNNISVLILTARDGLADRVEGLDQGADDFLVKPFEFAELKARIRALARRHVGRLEPELRTPFLTLDAASRSVAREGRSIRLTAREYALLHALMQRPGSILSRAQLENKIYGWTDTVESNAVEFLLHTLRQKIGSEQIENVRGVGWRVVTGR
jgi:two-component system response regulator QseB